MKYVITNFNADCSWITEYTDDYIVYDRSDCGLPNRIPRENVGDADYDKLSYLVDNYEALPDVFLWSKSNLFKYCHQEEFEIVRGRREFTPLVSKKHKTYADERGIVCFYDEDGNYRERNDSWFFNVMPGRYVHSWNEWADIFGLKKPAYIPFAPGGNYILTREVVHRFPKPFYEKMRSMLPYCSRPVEAQCAERSYTLMWK